MKTTTPARLAARLGIYTLGLLILAFGIALAVNCELGVSPVSSLPYVVSLIFNVSLGTCTTIVYATYVLLQMVLLRKFQPALLLQLVFSTIFGWFVDGAKYVLGDFCLPTYFGQRAMLAASIVLIGFSLVLYIDVKLAPHARRGSGGLPRRQAGQALLPDEDRLRLHQRPGGRRAEPGLSGGTGGHPGGHGPDRPAGGQDDGRPAQIRRPRDPEGLLRGLMGFPDTNKKLRYGLVHSGAPFLV